MLRAVALTELREITHTVAAILIILLLLLILLLHIDPKILKYLPPILIECFAEETAIENNLLQRVILKMLPYGIYKQPKDLIALR